MCNLRATRRPTLASLKAIGTFCAATSGSFKRRRQISGTIAARSPTVIAMGGGFMAASRIGPGRMAARPRRRSKNGPTIGRHQPRWPRPEDHTGHEVVTILVPSRTPAFSGRRARSRPRWSPRCRHKTAPRRTSPFGQGLSGSSPRDPAPWAVRQGFYPATRSSGRRVVRSRAPRSRSAFAYRCL